LLARFRKQGFPLNLVVNLDVPDEIILGRISDRWVHLPSGRVYNLSYNRPRVDGIDDETGEPLTKRPDDNPVGSGGVLIGFVIFLKDVARF
jgi:nucleoside-triphosphate--adenylate kinase